MNILNLSGAGLEPAAPSIERGDCLWLRIPTHTHTYTHESRVGSYKGNSNNNESTYSAVRSLWRKPGPVSGSGSGPNSGAWPVAVIGFANTPTCTHTHTHIHVHTQLVLRIRIRICLTPHNIAHVSDAKPWECSVPREAVIKIQSKYISKYTYTYLDRSTYL